MTDLHDQAREDKGLTAFAAYFRKNYPGPDTVIVDPGWHAPRIYRAALDAHRRATPADDLRAENERLREALSRIEAGLPTGSTLISGNHPLWRDAYRDLQRIARAALSKGGDA